MTSWHYYTWTVQADGHAGQPTRARAVWRVDTVIKAQLVLQPRNRRVDPRDRQFSANFRENLQFSHLFIRLLNAFGVSWHIFNYCSFKWWDKTRAGRLLTCDQKLTASELDLPHETKNRKKHKETIERGPMPNVMADLPNIGGALCSTPQSLADAQYSIAVQ